MQVANIPRVAIDRDEAMRSLVKTLDTLPDPRTKRTPWHSLTNIIAIALCAVVGDCDTWEDIEDHGIEHRSWFETFLDLPFGIPSRHTFRRVFARVEPRSFQALIVNFVESLREPDPADEGADDRHVAVDGKTLKSSFDRAAEQSPLHLVQAMATGSHLILAQVPTTVTEDEEVKKGNEITAIPRLLEQLDLTGAVVTIDAIGCQKAIAAKIVERGGGYMLALKDNHPTLCGEVIDCFEDLHSRPLPPTVRMLETREPRARGRSEERSYTIAPVPDSLYGKDEWAGLKTIVQAITVITYKDHTTSDSRYYLSTLEPDEIERAARCSRRHWRIESAHWVLDVTFGEDASRIRQGRAAENFGILRRTALALLKTHQTKLRAEGEKYPPSLRRLRKQASRSNDALASIVTQRS
jgi:predicted transposase YbfD/YdcC